MPASPRPLELAAQELAPEHAHGAMPLIHVEPTNQTLAINHTALDALAALPAPICVLAMGGGAHEGKSAWLNMFSQWIRERWQTVGDQTTAANFKVGDSVLDRGTEGAWIRLFSGQGARPSRAPEPRARAAQARSGHVRRLAPLPSLAHALPTSARPPMSLSAPPLARSSVRPPTSDRRACPLSRGTDGAALPGTQCVSLALLDLEAPSRALALDEPPLAATAAHKLFAFGR